MPLLKKDDPVIPKNYRPVALLPIFSKVLEKAVFFQLVDYLDKNNLVWLAQTTMVPGKGIILLLH